MFFSDLNALTKEAVEVFKTSFPLTERTPGEYVHMKYPRWIPIMQFETHQYKAEGFGNLTTFYTKGMGGSMQLLTMVCTPSDGGEIPFLLLDSMVMPKKKQAICFVEFYDCTKQGVKEEKELQELAKKYQQFPDYNEKPAWYIAERTPYSLVKSDIPEYEGRGIRQMVLDTVQAYTKCAKRAEKSEENLGKLRILQERMIKEGNPASSVLERLFGKRGAEQFFKQVIMPVPEAVREKK